VTRGAAARATLPLGAVVVAPTGIARVRVACTGRKTRVCRGTLALVRLPAGTQRRLVVLGRRQFAIAAGRQVAVKVRLNQRARLLLRRKGTLRARAIVTTAHAGGKRTTSRPVTLRLRLRRR
jgi:hypothetical protein